MAGDEEQAHLLPGLYESLVDRGVSRQIEALPGRGHVADVEPIDAADRPALLANHIRQITRQVLEGFKGEDLAERQAELCDRLIELLDDAPDSEDRLLIRPSSRLLAVWPQPADRTAIRPERPDTPLALGSLLAGTRLDPSLVSQLRKELASADRVDILCSFIKWSGLRILEDDLRAFTARPGARLRVLTTSYMGATDLKAVDRLQALPNTEVRVSYDTERTRLHAKAYLFHRHTGFSTAYVGSANLSRPALTEGLEWTVKVSRYETGYLWDRVEATFETYWEDGEFSPYGPAERPRLKAALEHERGTSLESAEANVPFLFELRPYPYQQEILDRIEAERELQQRNRHLVVAATGTGKTLIAVFDYQRWCRQFARSSSSAQRPRLLFVAHREEVLRQSLLAFRAVLRDPNFGDLLVGGEQPEQLDHLFASIQSYNSRGLHSLPADRYDFVVVDEFHHAAAPSYERLLAHVRPRVLLGLTATPERADELDVLHHFGGHLSAQIRLPDAINRKLLAPFQYFAVTDSEDLAGLRWQRGGYRTEDLDRVFTGNDLRASLVIDRVQALLLDPLRARGLGFCVSVAHAEFMARKFREAGIPAESLSASTPDSERRSARERLCNRQIHFLFVVDLYNEGVDLPEVDTILFLRPTESLTVFLQQLGRGLRLSDEKECLTVLDFVGHAHSSFRFDLRFRALLTDRTVNVNEQVEHGFTHLPAGCSILMERIARQHILENVGQAVRQTRGTLVRELREAHEALGRLPTLGEFLDRAQIEPDDLYRRKVSYRGLSAEAGLATPFSDPDQVELTRGLRRIAHVRDAEWIHQLLACLDPAGSPVTIAAGDPLLDRRLLMMDLSLWGRSQLPDSAQESLARLKRNPELQNELRALLNYRLQQIDSMAPRPVFPFACPLALHAPYTRDEVLAALGHWTRTRQKEMREGVLHLPEISADAFFITLQKSESQFSPTTMYQDYALNERLFHWQSQSTTPASSPTGRRYIEHESRRHTILLFVREHPNANGLSVPFLFLGAARYVSHTGSRPMSITWELINPLPARLYRQFARLAVA